MFERVYYPRFEVFKNQNAKSIVNEDFMWTVHYVTSIFSHDIPVFNGSSAEKCWEFVAKYPRNGTNRIIGD